jgi:NADPH:quinone reductase-like Zn-dependent oxidoreductase
MLERARVEPGEALLVTGASGGVGLALVQLAAARGATVIAMTTSGKAQAVADAGAACVLHRDTGTVTGQVRAAAPEGLDCVADVAGGPALGELLPLLRDDGRWVIAGAIGGPVITFDLRRLYLHNRTMIGSSMHTRRHFRRLVEIARSSSAVVPLIAQRYGLADIHRAQEEFRRGRHVGKFVLTM